MPRRQPRFRAVETLSYPSDSSLDMATAAFRSTTRKSVRGGADEDAGSSTCSGGGAHRRSRSLSRFPPPAPESDEFPTPRGRFVNKVRGSGFPEISLDDLADEFFRARAESDGEEDGVEGRLPANGRSSRRSSGAGYAMETEASRRRGRSVSRPPPDRRGVTANCVVANGDAPRRHRYSSVDPHRFINSENNLDVSNGYNTKAMLRRSGMGNFRHTASQKPTNTGYAMRRSMSQKNFFLSQDSYSSHSSLTDDEARDVLSSQSRNEKTIQAVYAQEKEHPVGDGQGAELYELMRKEVRHAVEEIRKELEKVSAKAEPPEVVNGNNIQPVKVIAELRRNYTNKLEESERRKQELLAELAAEEQRGQELTKIVKELLPSAQKAAPDRQARSSRRSRDRTRVSKRLTEEAERYFEDFLSNVEDTDLSSFDGERSDTSSTRRDAAVRTLPEAHVDLTKVASLPAETDGVVLPWLQWETSNDTTRSPSRAKMQEGKTACSESNHITSSRGSCNSEGNDSSMFSRKKTESKLREVGTPCSSSSLASIKGSFHMDDYLHLQRSEDLLFERLRQRQRIDSGGLILCERMLM